MLASAAILAGTLLILPAHSFVAVLASQVVAVLGGTLVIPALTSLTLGIVGKQAFPRQQGRNQAFNHAGIVLAALLVAAGTHLVGPRASFLALGGMAAGAIASVIATPGRAWNERRAHGWDEQHDDERPRHALRETLSNRRLMMVAGALALFNLGNGTMLALIVQRLATTGVNATAWTADYVLMAQLTMIPVALWAGSFADRRGRRRLLLLAFAILPFRAVLSALLTDPVWLILAELLDGLSSGLTGVAVPIVIADVTWGSGRTQTALGTVNALQGVGGALSGLVGGAAVHLLGWSGCLGALALPAILAVAIALWMEETS